MNEKQTVPNVHDVLKAIRELEKHPAVAAYMALLKSLEPIRNEEECIKLNSRS